MIVKNVFKWLIIFLITATFGFAQEVGEVAVVPDDTTKDPGLKPGDLAPSWALMYAPGKFEFLKNWTVERDKKITQIHVSTGSLSHGVKLFCYMV